MLLDFLYIAIFFGGLALGFFRGVVRLTIMLVSFYIAVFLASFYFMPFSTFIVNKTSTGPDVAIFMAFFIVTILTFVLVTLAGLYTFREVEMPGQLMYVDKFLGVFVALVLVSLVLGITSVMLWNMMITHGVGRIDYAPARIIGRNVQTSLLLKYFSAHILPRAYNFADPVLPDAVEILFRMAK